VFWFVADNEQATGNVRLQCQLVKDLLCTGIATLGLYFLFCRLRTGSGRHRGLERMGKLSCRLGAGISIASHQTMTVNPFEITRHLSILKNILRWELKSHVAT